MGQLYLTQWAKANKSLRFITLIKTGVLAQILNPCERAGLPRFLLKKVSEISNRLKYF